MFGRSPDEIFSCFLKTPCISLQYKPAVMTTREHLEEHNTPCPENILAPFVEEIEGGALLAQTEELINELNEVYFNRAICECKSVRCDLAKKIFESEAA